MNRLSILTKGLVKENPVLISLLGLCPALAVSSRTTDAFGMGLATTFVLLGANISIAALRNIIPDKVRIPCFIVFIAGFVTVVTMIVEAFAFDLFEALGIFLALITVNCIVFARVEIFAKKNTVINSAIDALGMGAGFTLALIVIASIREIFGSGTWLGMELPVLIDNNISIFVMAPGGFVVFGLLIAIVNKVSDGKAIKRKEFGCGGCPSACSSAAGSRSDSAATCEKGEN